MGRSDSRGVTTAILSGENKPINPRTSHFNKLLNLQSVSQNKDVIQFLSCLSSLFYDTGSALLDIFSKKLSRNQEAHGNIDNLVPLCILVCNFKRFLV